MDFLRNHSLAESSYSTLIILSISEIINTSIDLVLQCESFVKNASKSLEFKSRSFVSLWNLYLKIH